jgi:hypothetical protein
MYGLVVGQGVGGQLCFLIDLDEMAIERRRSAASQVLISAALSPAGYITNAEQGEYV